MEIIISCVNINTTNIFNNGKILKEKKENMFSYFKCYDTEFRTMIKWLNKLFWLDVRSKDNFHAIQDWHCYKSNKSTDFKRKIHCRKEICRNHQRDLPAIKAQERLNRSSTG